MANTGCDALGLDWTVNLADAKARVGHKVALQGNMDPSVLYAPAERIEQEVRSILSDFGQGSGHVFNLGHGIHQDVRKVHQKSSWMPFTNFLKPIINKREKNAKPNSQASRKC